MYASDLTPDWAGFCQLWFYIGAHAATYGWAPDYTATAVFLADGGFMGSAMRSGRRH